MELTKQISWSKAQPKLYHFRTLRGQEVDFVIEDRSRSVVGIEVKASTTVSTEDFKHLHVFAEASGKKFVCGIVLYTGKEILSFGKNLYALPINTLWYKE